ncbi:MAG TPA: YciI family protein [Ktedonobacterales bacterium]|nr:YciI family protein [Ktedonobacterales bacterium]
MSQEGKATRMVVAISTYLKPLEEVDNLYPAHIEWLMKHYTSGRFLGSGPRVPRTGGVILARVESREEFLALLADDPFQQKSVSRYEVFEFTPGPLPRRSPQLEDFMSQPLGGEGDESA